MILIHSYPNPVRVRHISGVVGRVEKRLGESEYLIGILDPQMGYEYPVVGSAGLPLYIISTRENLERFNPPPNP